MSALSFPPPRFVVRVALALRRFLSNLADSVVPAEVVLLERTAGLGQTLGLRVASRLRLVEALEMGPRSAVDLARGLNLDARSLHRLLRALAAVGIFQLRSDGRFENNRLSRAISSLGPTAEYFGSAANAAAWSDLERSIATGRAAFDRVHGVSVWQWFADHPEDGAEFSAAMAAVTTLYAPAVAACPAFEGILRLCDVGGGRGVLLAAALTRHPKLCGLLLDHPAVLSGAREHLAASGVMERVELAAGDFFESVPTGCDGYLLKQVLHDWDDERCALILRNCRRAMASGARLFLVEALVDETTAADIGPLFDLHMLVACEGGRERSLEEFTRLLAANGFRMKKAHPTASPMWVLEAVAV